MYHTTTLISIGAPHQIAEDLISIKSDFPEDQNNFILLKYVNPQMYKCYIKSRLNSWLSVCPWEEEPQAQSACLLWNMSNTYSGLGNLAKFRKFSWIHHWNGTFYLGQNWSRWMKWSRGIVEHGFNGLAAICQKLAAMLSWCILLCLCPSREGERTKSTTTMAYTRNPTAATVMT